MVRAKSIKEHKGKTDEIGEMNTTEMPEAEVKH